MTQSLTQQLTSLLGGNNVAPQERLGEYAIDGITPQAAVQPVERRVISEVMQWASSQGISVFPRGGGTKLFLGNTPSETGVALDLSRLRRVLDYAPADMTATVECGMTLARLQQELAVGSQYLPLQSPLAEQATIGGILASNSTGPLRVSQGQPRDWLIGISVISAEGVETKAGGKVVKNVTGYDLNKLYTGSMGTLGIIADATFKLSPAPAERIALLARFSSLEEGTRAAKDLLGQVTAPQGVQVIDSQAANQLRDALSSGHLSQLEGGLPASEALALVFLSGRPRAVARRRDGCTRSLRDSGATALTDLNEQASQTLLRSLTDLGYSGETRPHLGIRISAPPSSIAEVISRARGDTNLGFPPGVVADPGFGIVRLYWWFGSIGQWIDDSRVLNAIMRTRELARVAGGFAVVEHCPLGLKGQIDVWGDPPGGAEIMRRIKQKFDPRGIMSPGRFVGRL
jgi:glycolate oxidase FAD binding subunit